MSQLVEDLRAVRDLLGPRGENWTKGALARGWGGAEVPPRSPSAICWCLVGAIIRIGAEDLRRRSRLFEAVFEDVFGVVDGLIVTFNDDPHRTFSEISDAISRAIRASEGGR